MYRYIRNISIYISFKGTLDIILYGVFDSDSCKVFNVFPSFLIINWVYAYWRAIEKWAATSPACGNRVVLTEPCLYPTGEKQPEKIKKKKNAEKAV